MTDKPNLTIRSAYPQDAMIIARFIGELNRFEAQDTGISLNEYAQSLKRWLANDAHPCRFIVAQHNNEAIGYAAFYTGYDIASATHGTHLADIFVTHAARHQGAGKAMMAYIADHTASIGGEWLSLTVLKNNTAAKRFYQSLQGVVVDVDFIAFGKSTLSAWRNEAIK